MCRADLRETKNLQKFRWFPVGNMGFCTEGSHTAPGAAVLGSPYIFFSACVRAGGIREVSGTVPHEMG